MIRLTHIIAAMALILLAGLIGVEHLEGRGGGAAVPGLVLVAAPGLAAGDLEALRAHWPGASIEWVVAGDGPLEPFGEGVLSALARRGDATALFTAEAVGDRARTPWQVVLDAFPDLPDRPRLGWMVEAASRFVRAQSGPRAFAVGLVLEDPAPADPETIVDPLIEAARTLPSFRRTAIVLLGARDAEPVPGRAGRRWCLRIPVGSWGLRSRPLLADLLDPTW